jgi:hypothetical protein
MSFATIEELRSELTPDVRKLLMREIAQFADERNPEKRWNGDPQEAVEFVQSLKDAGALSEYLTSCDFGTATNIARLLAEALPTRTRPSSTDTSSSNSPSDSSSDSTTTATKTE